MTSTGVYAQAIIGPQGLQPTATALLTAPRPFAQRHARSDAGGSSSEDQAGHGNTTSAGHGDPQRVEPGMGTPTATVFYMVNGNSNDKKMGIRLQQLNQSFRLLVQHMLSRFTNKYWVTVFHTPEMRSALDLKTFRDLWPLTQFAEIETPALPAWANSTQERDRLRKAGKWLYCAGKIWEDDYQKMNVVRISTLWYHSVFSKFDYFMNLDTDMYLDKPFPFDPFVEMQSKKLVYAYHECGFEAGKGCLENLGKTIWEYASNRNLTDRLYGLDIHTLYAGNFGVGKSDFFRSINYQTFAQHLIANRMFWTRSWRDQSIWVYALAMFAPGLVEQWGGLWDSVLLHRSVSLGGFHRLGDQSRQGPKKGCTYSATRIVNATTKDKLCPCNGNSAKDRTLEFKHT